MDQLPLGKHSVVILDFPVANSWPSGHEKVTTVPKAVSRLEAIALSPGCNGGQSKRIYFLLNNNVIIFTAIQIIVKGFTIIKNKIRK